MVQKLVEEKLGSAFPGLAVKLFAGDIAPHIKAAVASGDVDVIIAGGGDGTISSAAGQLVGTKITLGALPLGTMNLFVQALGFSPKLEQALDELARAAPRPVDVGLVNGRAFLHQVSFGLQPRMAKLREKLGYRSRLTKMLASGRAMVMVALAPKAVRVNIDLDGEALRVSAPVVVVSNNPLGHAKNVSLPESLDAGVLGYYSIDEISVRLVLRLARDYLANRINRSDIINRRIGKIIQIQPRARRFPGYRKNRKSLLSSIVR